MRLFAVLLWLGIPATAFAQLTITGAVTDERGEPLPGASVGVVGTTIGTTADADGQFALVLPLPEAETLLEARFVGYQSAQRTIRQNDGSTTVVFQLAVDALQLDEIVVTGLSAATSRKQLGHAAPR